MWTVGLVLVLLLLLVVFRWKKSLDRSKRLPPGSMGWPFIGETIEFYSRHPDSFFASKQERYPLDQFKSLLIA
jgi:(+)-abscisic acid 8'-hydroxylase